MIEIYGYIVLALVIILLFFKGEIESSRNEREKSRLLDELSKANTAIISKSANEYTMMRTMDNVVKQDKPIRDPDIVDESELTDEEFDDAIDKRNTLEK